MVETGTAVRPRWCARPGAAQVVRVLAVVLPVIGGLVASQAMAAVVPDGTGVATWWGLVGLAGLAGLLVADGAARRLLPLVTLLPLELTFGPSHAAPSRARAGLTPADPASPPPAGLDARAAMIEATRRAASAGDRLRRLRTYAEAAARDLGVDADDVSWAAVFAAAGPWGAGLAATAAAELGDIRRATDLVAVASAFDDLVGPDGGEGPDALFAARRELAHRATTGLDADAVRAFLAVPPARLRDVPGARRLLAGTPLLAAVHGLGDAARPVGVGVSGLALIVVAGVAVTADRLLPVGSFGTLFPTPPTRSVAAPGSPDEVAPIILASGDAGALDVTALPGQASRRFVDTGAASGAAGSAAGSPAPSGAGPAAGPQAAPPSGSVSAPQLTSGPSPAATPPATTRPGSTTTDRRSEPPKASEPTTSNSSTKPAKEQPQRRPDRERRPSDGGRRSGTSGDRSSTSASSDDGGRTSSSSAKGSGKSDDRGRGDGHEPSRGSSGSAPGQSSERSSRSSKSK